MKVKRIFMVLLLMMLTVALTFGFSTFESSTAENLVSTTKTSDVNVVASYVINESPRVDFVIAIETVGMSPVVQSIQDFFLNAKIINTSQIGSCLGGFAVRLKYPCLAIGQNSDISPM